ncbi:YCF48-related protein [Flavobacterium sp. DGU11]|uniref:YCF48-related protein n=1 Tax=Flavobacterium arundinis TaxID=3139143 RepID=A0ABU9HY35_9FLAO
MKRILQFCCLILSTSAFSQNGWQLLNPTPSYNNGIDIHFSSPSTGYIITEDELLETTDAGQNWHFKQSLINATDIHFKNNIGVIAGLSGYAMKSTDSGATWAQMNTTTSQAFNSVTVLDANNIILSSSTKLVKTSDGGVTWQTLNIPDTSVSPSLLVKKTIFITPLIGHAVCNSKRIMKTIDGGATWYFTELTTNNSTDFITVFFADANNGYASDSFGKLMKTTDAGETWTELQNISMEIRSIFFLDANKGYVAGDVGRVYKTNNGGTSWQAVDTPNSYIGQMDLNGIYFTNANKGFSTGVRGRILKTTNGGTAWAAYSPSYFDTRSIDFVSNNEGFALLGGQCYNTTDGGVTWSYRGEVASEFITPTKIEFVNANIGYMAAGSFVFKTIDGGITWTVNNGGAGMNMTDIKYIEFIDENIGYVSQHNYARLFKTTNGGTTWQQVSNQINNSLQFINANVGYSLRSGKVFKTVDGGNTWNATNDSNLPYGIDINFVNEDDGFALGTTSIRRTTDGGLNWQNYSLPGGSNYSFNYLKFITPNTGYIATETGVIFQTTDGGQSWSPVFGTHDISTITFNNGYLYIGGIWGRISRNQTGVLSQTDYIAVNKNITIYPVPVLKDLNIGTENLIIDKIEMFDLSGKNILIQNAAGNSTGVYDVSPLESGIYIIKIYSENKVHTKKFIKS